MAFGSKNLNIYAVGDAMGKRGWHLNALSSPAALHMAFTVSYGSLTGCASLYNANSA